MAILEEEVRVVLNNKLISHFENLNYDIPRRRDKWGTFTVPKGTEILINVTHLPKGSHMKLTKICDNPQCDIYGGRHVKNQQYRAILISREENDGFDLCRKCLYIKRGNTRRNNVDYNNSLENFALENSKKYLLLEFSENNNKRPNMISKFTHDKFLWNCFVCGEKDFEMSVANRTKLNQNCPKCAGNIKKSTDQYKQEVFYLVNDEYEVIDEYVDAKTPIQMKHSKCEQIYPVSPNNFLRGRRCPYCSESKGESVISNWLKINNISYTYQMEFENLVGLKGGNLSYDFFLHEQNLLIEYQGEFHDGSNGEYTKFNLESQKEHDRRKQEYAKQNNIKLLEIWYWDYKKIEEILEKTLSGRN